MKTYNLNGFDVVVCCDPMGIDLSNGVYWIYQPMLDDDWPECFGLYPSYSDHEDDKIDYCEHCEREVVVR